MITGESTELSWLMLLVMGANTGSVFSTAVERVADKQGEEKRAGDAGAGAGFGLLGRIMKGVGMSICCDN